ncbi:MAG: hypothetical protein KC729_01315, partial [Candidatus Eisenbacteria bacterium]|nr:hypothetical protein [Candidatus Eisenbacteria bacterium]
RGVVDYVVLSLLVLAILWNVIQLTRRVHAVGGGRSVWHVQRTVLFWIVGLMNSVLIRPELAGSWRNYVGWGMLALAVFDTVLLFRSERRAIAMQVVAETGQPVPERE